MAKYFGANPPFWGGPQNILSRQEDEQLIKNDLLQLLLTVPGERVNRPSFGTILRSFVFEQNTPTNITILENSILTAIADFEPRVNVESLTISPRSELRQTSANEHTIYVKLVVSLKSDPQQLLTIERLINQNIGTQ